MRRRGVNALEKNDSETILAQTSTWAKLGDARWGAGGRKTEGDSPVRVPVALRNL